MTRTHVCLESLRTGARVFQHAYSMGLEGIVAAWSLSRKKMSVATRQAAALGGEECRVGKDDDASRRRDYSLQKRANLRAPASGQFGTGTALHHVLLLGSLRLSRPAAPEAAPAHRSSLPACWRRIYRFMEATCLRGWLAVWRRLGQSSPSDRHPTTPLNPAETEVFSPSHG